MKYLFFLLIMSALILSCTSTDKKATASVNPKDSTTIQWIDSAQQYVGRINEGEKVEILWHFKNSGDKPLLLADVKGSCGCTATEWPKQPIAPGKEEIIKAQFDSHDKPGSQQKYVTVQANILNGHFNKGVEQLTFTVDVNPKK